VIGEREKLRIPVRPRPAGARRKELIRVEVFRELTSLPDDRGERKRTAFVRLLSKLLEKAHDFCERDLPPAARRCHRGDLTFADPAIERGLADTKKTSSLGPSDNRTCNALEIAQNRLDLFAVSD
jgi:hypothetical protein